MKIIAGLIVVALVCMLIYKILYTGKRNSSNDLINMDELPSRELWFDELDEDIKKAYLENPKRNLSFPEMKKAINLDGDNVDFQYERPSVGKTYMEAIKDPHDYFFIDTVRFILPYKKGYPFILKDKKLYYTKELNMYPKDIPLAKYVEVDLSSCISK